MQPTGTLPAEKHEEWSTSRLQSSRVWSPGPRLMEGVQVSLRPALRQGNIREVKNYKLNFSTVMVNACAPPGVENPRRGFSFQKSPPAVLEVSPDTIPAIRNVRPR